MAPKRQRNRVSAHTLRKRVDEAMADFTRPTLDEMLKEGNRLFKPERRRRAEGTKRRVTVLRQDNPESERSSNLTLAAVLSEILLRSPRKANDPEWSFALGGRRNYVFINTSGPGVFSGGYPVWRRRKFAGCMMFSLQRKDVRRVLERFCAGRSMSDSFPEHGGEFTAY